jgi:hypothetical protein
MTDPNFTDFAHHVRERLLSLTAGGAQVLLTTASKDDLWNWYLMSFPEGTNPIFRERTVHDCACCRSFIKNLGRIVVLDAEGNYQTVWDGADAFGFLGTVATALAAFIREHPIAGTYHSRETSYGNLTNLEKLDNGETITWNHFQGDVPAQCITASVGEAMGATAAVRQVLNRGLEEDSLAALEVVNDLIASKSIYRGEEHARDVANFLALKQKYDETTGNLRTNFSWMHVSNPAARFRNTVIGTLVSDLVEGMGVNQAVGRFEAKVAPQNYKRSSAPITAGMVKKAVETLRGLGLESALKRRFATIEDVSVNDVLFVDRAVRSSMKDGLLDTLMAEIAVTPTTTKKGVIDISGEAFLSDVLPGAASAGIQLDKSHLGNFLSLTAPVEEDVAPLFQWNNNFAWAYDGDVTDGIKQRVKSAGGNVSAWLRVSLGWYNYDDLDIHCKTPDGGDIGYQNKAGVLDVDMNAGGRSSREAVENLAFSRAKIKGYGDGKYEIYVHQYAKREQEDVGFEIEYEYNGETRSARYDKPVRAQARVPVMTIVVKKGEVVSATFSKEVVGGSSSVDKWGVSTGQLVPIDTVLLSPNYWNGQGRGNKHHIFVLRDCKNPTTVRGFFNEYLRGDLHEHRKVFEVLGSKTTCPMSDDQISGVGFSSTRKDRAIFVVSTDDSTRTYNVQF